jgi:transcription initiation factor TFIIB
MIELERELAIEFERERPEAEKAVSDCCPECGSTLIVQDHRRGETYCQSCGTVIDESAIDPRPEWTYYESRHIKRVRTGPPLQESYHDRGLCTQISIVNKDYSGRKLPTSNAEIAARLRRVHRMSKASKSHEKNMIYAMTEIDRMVSALSLSYDIKEEAAHLYRKLAEGGLKGKNIDALTSAIVYAVCRKRGLPRGLKEVVKVSKANKKEICRAYKHISKELGIQTFVPSPIDFLPKLRAALDLPPEIVKRAEEILRMGEEIGITGGRDPRSLAAAAVYIASQELMNPRTQKQIAKAAEVTEVTIRNRYKELCSKLDIQIFVL